MHILAVHHDVTLAGGSLLFASILERLASRHSTSVTSIVPRSGDLVPRLSALGPVLRLPPAFRGGLVYGVRRAMDRYRFWRRLRRLSAPDVLYANSAASIPAALQMARTLHLPLALHIHESEYLLSKVCPPELLRAALIEAKLVIAVTDRVAELLISACSEARDKIQVVHGFAPDRPLSGGTVDSANLLPGIPADASVIFACGSLCWYKGADLMPPLMALLDANEGRHATHLVWAGAPQDSVFLDQLQHDMKRTGTTSRIHLVGSVRDPEPLYRRADTFLIPSREDSWPLVMIEAARHGLPIICFQSSGGAEQFVASGCGRAVPYLDLRAMAEAVRKFHIDPEARATASQAARKAANSISPERTVQTIYDALDCSRR